MRVSLTLTVVIAAAAVGPQRSDDLQRAFDRYRAGEAAAAIEAVDSMTTAGALRAAAEQWIRNGDSSTLERRRRVAAAFALETVWAATRASEVIWDFEWRTSWTKPWDSPVSSVRSVLPILAWGCDLVTRTESRDAADAPWFLASVGVLQDVRASAALLEYRGQPAPQSTWDPLLRRELAAGHLVHARAHVPGEGRWKLAELLAQSDRELGTPPNHQRTGVLRNEVWRPQALPGIQERLSILASEPPLSAEARLRVAYADIKRKRWREALAGIDQVRPALTERFLIAVAEYLRGWSSERLGRRDEAIFSYRRVLELAPGIRNVRTLLAAQLYLGNQQAEAYQLFERMLDEPSYPRDLIVQFERGDARLVPDHLARLREALR